MPTCYASPLAATFLVPALFALLAGCGDQDVRSYRVPKESVTVASPTQTPAVPATLAGPMSGPNMASTPVTTASGDGLAWTAPAHWQTGPEKQMRKATLLVPGDGGATAELAITAFPGDVGGNLANVNRWRQQLALPPIGVADLDQALSHLDFNGLHGDVVDLLGPAGPARQRVLGAIVPFNGATWFFKLTGPDALVAHEKDGFLAFLKTVRPR